MDFVCLERKLIVEVDGGQHTVHVQQDSERTAWLESVGYQVVRFWDHEILTELESVKEALRRSVTPTSILPLKGGGDLEEGKDPHQVSLPPLRGKDRMGGRRVEA